MGFQKFTSGLDSLGMATSTLCALHCLLVPLLVTALPFWGLGLLAEPWIDNMMIGAGLFIGTLSLGLSYFRHHHSLLPLLLFIAGFGLIVVIHLTHGHQISASPYSRIQHIAPVYTYHSAHGAPELILLFLGGIVIAMAHFLNWRYTRRYHTTHKRIKPSINEKFSDFRHDQNPVDKPPL